MKITSESADSVGKSESRPDRVSYRVDARGIIVSVGDSWRQFAAENQGTAILEDPVIGKSLWGYILDGSLRSIYQSLIKRAQKGEDVFFRYRCDAPAKKRWLAMVIRRVENEEIEFESTLLWEEPRAHVKLLDPIQPRSEHYVRVCSWCSLVESSDGKWLPVEEAVRALDLMGQDDLPKLTHTICPSCKNVMLAPHGGDAQRGD